MKKNITVTLDAELAQWVRVWAAKHGKSVSLMVAELIGSQRTQDAEYVEAKKRMLSAKARDISGGKPYPKRDEVYD